MFTWLVLLEMMDRICNFGSAKNLEQKQTTLHKNNGSRQTLSYHKGVMYNKNKTSEITATHRSSKKTRS